MTFNPHTTEDRQAMLDAVGVETVDDLMDVMEDRKVGDRVQVDVIRNNKRLSVGVTLQAVN